MELVLRHHMRPGAAADERRYGATLTERETHKASAVRQRRSTSPLCKCGVYTVTQTVQRVRREMTHSGLFLFLLCALPCALTATDKSVVSKEEYYSATVNATVLDSRGNPKRLISKDDGRYGQNSPKAEAKGIVVTPVAVNGGDHAEVTILSLA
ncbi:hypothetical protein NFI96_000970 [Prochilodus magdalenae]|nr:hypothetical protein NFI96_000970 [Prochilodus magdalenae]